MFISCVSFLRSRIIFTFQSSMPEFCWHDHSRFREIIKLKAFKDPAPKVLFPWVWGSESTTSCRDKMTVKTVNESQGETCSIYTEF